MHEQHLVPAHDDAACRPDGQRQARRPARSSSAQAPSSSARARRRRIALLLDEPSGGERRLVAAPLGQLAQVLLGDDGVLVLADDVLEALRAA